MIDRGSPPHTWRIQAARLALSLYDRITSTYVENTLDFLSSHYLNQDHLHIRGEYQKMLTAQTKQLGSPPHTWRILYLFSCFSVEYGITSTYVENTIIPWLKNMIFWDHLHIRGEYKSILSPWCLLQGSPPHTWRIPNVLYNTQKYGRITSTYVENTLF